MPNIQRGTISEEFRNGLDLDTARTGKHITEASEKVVLTYDYSNARYANIVRTGTASNATTATIYTTPSDADFYMTSVTISMIKDATATSVYSGVNFFINGVVYNFRIDGFTLTAQADSLHCALPAPVKVDRNTAITAINSTNVANVTCRAVITGFEVR